MLMHWIICVYCTGDVVLKE